jgi:hypothetical protein
VPGAIPPIEFKRASEEEKLRKEDIRTKVGIPAKKERGREVCTNNID